MSDTDSSFVTDDVIATKEKTNVQPTENGILISHNARSFCRL
jgi:hypothetical protein